MPYDRSPMILGNKVPYGRGSLEGAEPPFDDGFPHGRVGPAIPGDAGQWVIVPADVPYDGRYYVRQNRDWVVTTFLDALPNDLANIYGRKRNLVGPDTWEMVVGESPADNRTYARENGMWVPVSMFNDAPVNEYVYGRSNSDWKRVCEDLLANEAGATWAMARRDGQWWKVPLDLTEDLPFNVVYGRVRIGPTFVWIAVPPEAPMNTNLYGRQNGTWVAIAPTIGEPPLDGNIYGRGGTPVSDPMGWKHVCREAPPDGKLYARRSATWEEIVIPIVPPTIPEAPVNQYVYGRTQQGATGQNIWDEVPGEIPEIAPIGRTYGRARRVWYEVPREIDLTDAVPDRSIFVRQKLAGQGRWIEGVEEVPAGTGAANPKARISGQWVDTLLGPEPTRDGQPYARVMSTLGISSWTPTVTRNSNDGNTYVRRMQEWERFNGAWINLELIGTWAGDSELRYRVIGGCQLEFVGSLTFPTGSFVAGDLNVQVATIPTGPNRPTISQQFCPLPAFLRLPPILDPASQALSMAGMLIQGNNGAVILYGLSQRNQTGALLAVIAVPAIHFTVALN